MPCSTHSRTEPISTTDIAARRAAELTGLGGFAVLQVDPEGLLPLAEALHADRLSERFAATRAGLASGTGVPLEQVPPRTAVSAAQAGLVSRFWSVALASLALHGWVPDLAVGQVLVADSHRNPSPLALADPGAGRPVADDVGAASSLRDLVVNGAVRAVTEACGEHGRTSLTVLVSNAASALVSAARVVGHRVPGRAAELDRVARLLLEDPWLAAGGGYRPSASAEERSVATSPGFRRAGCCLYYRLPGHGLCPDCILVGPGRPASEHH